MDTDSLRERLRVLGLTQRCVDNGIQLFKQFIAIAEPFATESAEMTESNQQPSMERARAAWCQLCETRKWSNSYRRRAMTSLLRVLEAANLSLIAKVLNPRLRPHRRRVTTATSHETHFYLHDCLPLAVRHLSIRGALYQTLFRITEQFIRLMRSACRHSLKKRMNFISRLLQFDKGSEEFPVLLGSDCTDPPQVVWDRLCAVRAAEWLVRMDALYAGRTMNPKTFQGHVTTLRVLHGDIFGPRGDSDGIPNDVSTACIGVTVDGDEDEGYSDADSDDAIGGDRATARLASVAMGDGAGVAEKRALLYGMRMQMCPLARGTGGVPPPRTAFTPEEVTRILDAAKTTMERLIVMLLITTGMRLGGLCRLRAAHRMDWAFEIPDDALSTVEKNNRPRIPVLLYPVRILLARYFREDRPPASPFVFPAPRDPQRKSLNTSTMWKMIKVILHRACVVGRHAHPHAFRHSYVHMMRLLGAEPDVIAKLVGHSSVATTERVYSRFSNDEMAALTASVPVFGGSIAESRNALRDQWKAVAQRLNNPYEFSEREWKNLIR